MNKESSIFYYLFLAALLVFFIRTAMYWYNAMNFGTSTHDFLLYVSLCLVEFIILVFLLLNIRKSYWMRGVHVICLLWLLMSFISLPYNGSNIQSFVKVIIWPMLFEATYLFINEDKKRLNDLHIYYYAVLVIGAVVFLGSILYNGFGGQTNSVYYVILTAPFLLLAKKNNWRYFILGMVTFVALLSMKRSMMLAFLLFWMIIAFSYLIRTKRIVEAVFVSFFFIGLGFFAFNFVDDHSDGYLSSRFEDEDMTNGRERIYEVTLLMIQSSDIEHIILGHGHNAVRLDSPLEISAHNEFLEIIYDYGIVVFILYLFFWLYIIRRWLFHIRCRTSFYIPYTLSICIFAVMAMVSQLILYASYFLYLVMFWAAVEAVTENDYKEYRRLRRVRKGYS